MMTMGVSTWTVSAMWPTVSIPEGIINKVLQTCDKAIFQFPKKSDCVYTAHCTECKTKPCSTSIGQFNGKDILNMNSVKLDFFIMKCKKEKKIGL